MGEISLAFPVLEAFLGRSVIKFRTIRIRLGGLLEFIYFQTLGNLGTRALNPAVRFSLVKP